MHPDALLMLQTVFNVLDTNLDGRVSFDEIRQGIEGTPLGDNVLGYLSDIIGDKQITFRDFLGLFTQIHPDEVEEIRDQWLAKYYARMHTPAVVELYTTVFRVWDTDNSGSISLQELIAAVTKAELDHPDIIPYLCSADVNNDGTISLKEFLAFMPHVSDEDLPLMADRLLGAWMKEEEEE
jgi:Ca2+-binding EF-hand superfamily protein